MCLAEVLILILPTIQRVLPIEFPKIEKMKKQLLVYSILLITLSAFSQKQFSHIATKANNSCNGDCTLLDNPDLNGNSSAVIWATPVLVNGTNLNPHPIGVYYFKNKWSIFNLDQKPIPEGSTFTVVYVARPDDSHFQYSFTREDIQADGSALIDHPALNNNPTAKFSSFPSWDPAQRSMATREETTIQYNNAAGKWSMSNTNQKSLSARVAFNIIVSSAGNINTPRTSTVIPELVINTSNTNTVSGPVLLFVTAWADKIRIPGDKSNPKYPDRTQLRDFDFSVSRPLAGRGATKNYDPITIKIITGVPGTIPFFEAFIKKSVMDFTFEAFTNTDAAKPELNYTIKLSGATIVSFKQMSDRQESDAKAHSSGILYFDEIKIMFTKIEFIKDNVTVEDIL